MLEHGFHVEYVEQPARTKARQSRFQRNIILGRALLVDGLSLAEAARKAGVSPPTAAYLLRKIAPDELARRAAARQRTPEQRAAKLREKKRRQRKVYYAKHRERICAAKRERNATDPTYREKRLRECAVFNARRANRPTTEPTNA